MNHDDPKDLLLFIKSSLSFGLAGGVLLFGSSISGQALASQFAAKLLSAAILGIVGGFATVAGKELWQWVKRKYKDRKKKNKYPFSKNGSINRKAS